METVNTNLHQDLRFLKEIEQFDTSFNTILNLSNNPTNPNCPNNKRQSPSSFQELPSSKRAAASSPPHNDGGGFTKLPLPLSFPSSTTSPPPPPPPPLVRTISEPIRPSLVQESPSGVQNPLCRTASDPNPVSNGVPPRVPERAENCSEESPDTRRLKRIRERIREMNQWWNKVVREDEEDEVKEVDGDRKTELEKCGKDTDQNNTPKEDNCDHQPLQLVETTNVEEELPSQEAVWVEKVDGNCLVLHFKCPCGSVYQILLSGNNCYYKLTNL